MKVRKMNDRIIGVVFLEGEFSRKNSGHLINLSLPYSRKGTGLAKAHPTVNKVTASNCILKSMGIFENGNFYDDQNNKQQPREKKRCNGKSDDKRLFKFDCFKM